MKKTFRKGKRCAKKVISVLLACTMVFAMFGICASATETNEIDGLDINKFMIDKYSSKVIMYRNEAI